LYFFLINSWAVSEPELRGTGVGFLAMAS
jgi:hypothetical protein